MIKKYTLKNGKVRYQFQIYIGTDDSTQKQMRTTRRGFKTKKEAELALARLKLQVNNGEYRKERADTFKEVYELWLPQYENTVEQSTFVKTVSLFEHHILPSIGDYKIKKITIDRCQKAVNDWAEKIKNISKVKAYTSRVFNFAIKRDYIQKNPFDIVEVPRKKNKQPDETDEKNFYTREQLIEFLSCLENETNVKAHVFFRLLAFSGMRKGEAFALTWNDIRFNTNEIRINKAISRGQANKLYVKTTKTNEARSIKMDEKTMDVLKKWKKKQKDEYFKLGFDTSEPTQLVFSNKENELLQPNKTRDWIIYVQEKYHLMRVTTHGLRHTHCSLLFEAGATLKEVQDRLGHSDIKTTMNIYTHVTDKAQEQAIQKFSSYIDL
ncbi:site-specific integrase [Gracilibacillus caseinilyticus]|uniref:Site-specific integrase n=1 Tax=Gracilibacillus caseinilyticus TaxID=2932256 RepID=A0ABY4EWQ0_9BACI|nr:site-specific integrase [Gracilibacillus caseinilyticus]UOQ48848.1 site-specific integrase [Gracilibacillus caseinilyticus]